MGQQRWEWADGRVVSTRYNSEYPTVYTHDDLGRVIEMDNNAGAAVVGPDYLFEYENVAETPECGMVFSSCTARVGRLARVLGAWPLVALRFRGHSSRCKSTRSWRS